MCKTNRAGGFSASVGFCKGRSGLRALSLQREEVLVISDRFFRVLPAP